MKENIIQSYKEFMVRGKLYDRKVYGNMLHNGFAVLNSDDDFEVGKPTKDVAQEYIDWHIKTYPNTSFHFVYYAHMGDFQLRYVVVYGKILSQRCSIRKGIDETLLSR